VKGCHVCGDSLIFPAESLFGELLCGFCSRWAETLVGSLCRIIR
jgi:hypothetical protein